MGSLTVGLISSGASCAIEKMGNQTSGACNNFVYTVGSSLITPQEKISSAVDSLSNPEQIKSIPDQYRQSYIDSKKSEIGWGILVTLAWFYILYWFFSKFPAMNDMGTKIIIFILIITILSLGQSLFGQAVLGQRFVIPFSGFVKLILHPDVLAITANHFQETAAEYVNPIG